MYNHQNHNHHRQDVFTIANPMTYTYGGAMGNKSSTGGVGRTQPAEISHETWLALDNTADRNSVDHKKPPLAPARRDSKMKFFINAILLLFVVAVISSVEFGYLPHTKQSFFCGDPTLSFKFKGDTIRPSVLGVVCVALPAVVFLIVEYSRVGNAWRTVAAHTWRWGRLYVIGSIVINLFITEVLKSVCGELRPHFFDTCAPDAVVAGCEPGELIEHYRCTNTQHSFMMVRDSSRSFPSGHASLAMFTSVYCSAYIYYRFHTPALGSLLKPFFITIVLLWGPVCGLTRISDHRHHWWDVLAGAGLGALVAIFTVCCMTARFRCADEGTGSRKPCTSVSSTKLYDTRNNKDDESV